MAQLGTNFDPASAPPSENNFDLIPNGWQPMHAIESDVNPTKDGTGTIVAFTFEIIEGAFKGRRIWKRMNVQNKSAEAQAIGQRELADLCRALGLPSMTNTESAHGKPLMGRIGVEKGKDGYEDKNTVKAFKPYEAGTGSPAVVAAVGGAPAAAGGAARPWG